MIEIVFYCGICVAMGLSVEFQPYLDSIIRHYGKWQRLYTLTDAEGRKAEKDEETPFFDFGLMVQSVVKEEDPDNKSSSEEEKEKIERFTVLEGLRKYADEHVLLVGRPGSGKSTALARLMLETTQTALSSGSSPKWRRGEAARKLIPVLVELRSWQKSVLELVQSFCRRHELRLTVEQIEVLLDEQRLVLLLDGVNELPSEGARRDVNEFRKNHPKVPMVFTTRDLGLGGDLRIEKKLEMQPLTDQQMQTFVEAYLPEKAEEMLQQLKGRLRELGQTPLLLWMLCSLFKQREEIPQNLGEVFRAFTQGYEQRIKQDVVVESDRRLWPELLKELAVTMMRGKGKVDFRVAIAPEEAYQTFGRCLATDNLLILRQALDDLLKYHLIQRNGDLVEFRHQLIQEYYASEWLLDNLSVIKSDSFNRDYLNFLKWTEPITLMMALMDDESLVIKIVRQAIDIDWGLGARLAGEVPQKIQEEAVNQIPQIELQLWLNIEPFKHMAVSFILPKLRKALKDKNPRMRGAAAEALESLGPEIAIPLLTQVFDDPDSHVRWRTVDTLGKLGSEAAIPVLTKALKDSSSFVRLRASEILGEIGSATTILILAKALEYSSPETGGNASNILEKLDSETAIPGLLLALEDEDNDVRRISAEALENIGSETTIPGLLLALEDEDNDVRQISAKALGNIGSEMALLIYGMKNFERAIASLTSKILFIPQFSNADHYPDVVVSCDQWDQNKSSYLSPLFDRGGAFTFN